MVSRRSPASSRWLRVIFVSLGLSMAGAFLAGSSCARHDDDDDDFLCDDDNQFDDDDDDFDDDDGIGRNCDDNDDCCDDDDDGGFIIILDDESARNAFTLTGVTVVKSVEAHAHPVESVQHIRGVSLSKVLGPGEYGAEQFEEFTRRIIDSNPDLLGLPEGAGTLQFAGLEFHTHTILVSYRQGERLEGEGFVPVPGAALYFLFDALGNLVQIDNRTRIP